MSEFISINTNDLMNIDNYLNSLDEINYANATSFQKLCDGVLDIIRQDIELRFINSPPTTKGGVVLGNEYWKPLSEYSFKQKPYRRSGQLLIDSGKLRDSMIVPDFNDQYKEFTPVGVNYGSDVKYADKVQEQRPYIFLHPELMQNIKQYLINELFNQ